MTEEKLRLFYLLIIVIASMVLAIIYSKTNENIGNKREVRAFKGMLISFMIYTLVDLRLVYALFYTALPRIFVLFVIGTGFFSMTFACYFWFSYVASSAHIKAKNTWLLIAKIPLVLIAIALYTPLYRFIYELTDEPTFSPLLFIIIMIDYVYLILATIFSVQRLIREKNKLERGKYIGQLFFIIFYTFSGYIMTFFLNVPAIEFCMMPVVLKLFVDLQDSRIYTDALTRLDNRRRINMYLEEEISKCNEEKPLTVMMLDIDFFKNINDTFGHDEGDSILIAFSAALSKLTSSKHARAGRWGGDEFIIVGKEKNLSENFRESLKEELENNKDLRFVPRFSIGSYVCKSQGMTVKQAISKADEQLYKDKEIQHSKYEDFQDMIKDIKIK